MVLSLYIIPTPALSSISLSLSSPHAELQRPPSIPQRGSVRRRRWDAQELHVCRRRPTCVRSLLFHGASDERTKSGHSPSWPQASAEFCPPNPHPGFLLTLISSPPSYLISFSVRTPICGRQGRPIWFEMDASTRPRPRQRVSH